MSLERWRAVDRIFQLASEVDASRRERLLDRLCREDPSLRSEVELLLEHEAGPETLLDRVGNLLSVATLPIRPGDKLGNWRIGSILGEGGSSVVFEADRVDQRYERRVAVKVLKQALLTEHSLERFHRECHLLAGLDHPHIARLEDAGATDHGLPYIVLERVDGVALDRWRRQRRPSPDERLALFQRVCSAVAFAHRNLVVHRDLKPGNVLVTADGQPKLLDFGIARVLAGDRWNWSRLTRSHPPMTPQYASPEQLRGEDVSTASDVYSLGLLLYELLTGRLPYTVSEDSGETLSRLVDGKVAIPPPSVATAESEDDPGVPAGVLKGDLDTIVLTAVETDSERRYPSAQALGEEIDRFRRGLPILARVRSPGYVFRRFVGRHRLAVAAALALLLLTLGFAVSMGVVAGRLRVQEALALSEAATAREVVAFLGGLFEGAEPAVHQGRQLSARELLDRGAAAFESRDIEDETTSAALSSAIGKAYLELSVFPEARRFLERSFEERARRGDPQTLAESLLLLARLDLAEAEFENAVDRSRQALLLLTEDADGGRASSEAGVLLGRSLMALGELDAGEEALWFALTGLDADRSPQEAGLVGLAHQELAGAMLKRGRWQEARPLLDRALELLTATHGELHPYVFETQRMDSFLSSALEPPDGPTEPTVLLALLDRQKQLYGRAHEQMMWTLTDIASAYTIDYRDDLGERYYREALAMREALVADDHLVLAIVHAGLGHIARRKGDFERSIDHFERSLEISRRRFAADSIDLAYPQMTLGHALSRVGRCEEAEELLAAAHSTFSHQRPRTDFNRTESLWGWGFALACLGDERGEKMMWTALDVARQQGWSSREGLRNDVAMWRELTPPRSVASTRRSSLPTAGRSYGALERAEDLSPTRGARSPSPVGAREI